MENYAQLGVEVDVSQVTKAEQTLLKLIGTLEKMVDANEDLKKAFAEVKSNLAGTTAEANKTEKSIKKTGDAAKGAQGSVGLLGVAFDELSNAVPGVGNLVGTLSRVGSAASAGVGGMTSLGAATGVLVGTGVGLAAVAGALGAVAAISFGSTINSLAQLADQTGRSVTEVSALSSFLNNAGLDLQEYEDSLRDVQNALSKTGDAASGESKAFKVFGVTLKETTTAEEAALQVAQRYTEAKRNGTLTSEQYAAAIALIGDDADKAAKAILIAAAAEEFRQNLFNKGIGITEESKEASLQFGIAQAKAGVVITAMGSRIVQDLLPPITNLIEAFTKSYTEGGLVKDLFDGLINVSNAVVFGVRAIGLAFEYLWAGVRQVGAGLTGVLDAVVLLGSGQPVAALNALVKAGEKMGQIGTEANQTWMAGAKAANDARNASGQKGTVRGKGGGPGATVRGAQTGTDQAAETEAATKALDEYILSLNEVLRLERAREQAIVSLMRVTDDEGQAVGSSKSFAIAARMAADQIAVQEAVRKAEELAVKAGKPVGEAKEQAARDQQALNAVRNKLSATALISAELERQRDIAAIIGGVDGERARLLKQMNDAIALATDDEKKRLELERDRVTAQYDKNAALRLEKQFTQDILSMSERMLKVKKDIYTSYGFTPEGRTDYRTRDEVRRADAVRQAEAPFIPEIDRLQREYTSFSHKDQPERAAALRKQLADVTVLLEESRAEAERTADAYNHLNNSVNILNGDFTAWAHGGLLGVVSILDRMPTQAQAAATMVETVGQALEDGIVNAFETGKFSVEDFFKTILKQLARLLTQLLVIKPLMDAIRGYATGGATANAAATVGSSSQYSLAGSGVRFGSYDGNVVQRLSSGGIVNTLSSFNTTAGRTTVAEKNAEAIMPLQRNSKGQLGVIQAGGSAAPNINFAPAITVQVGSVQDASDPGKIAQAVNKQIEQKFKQLMAEQNRYAGAR